MIKVLHCTTIKIVLNEISLFCHLKTTIKFTIFAFKNTKRSSPKKDLPCHSAHVSLLFFKVSLSKSDGITFSQYCFFSHMIKCLWQVGKVQLDRICLLECQETWIGYIVAESSLFLWVKRGELEKFGAWMWLAAPCSIFHHNHTISSALMLILYGVNFFKLMQNWGDAGKRYYGTANGMGK